MKSDLFAIREASTRPLFQHQAEAIDMLRRSLASGHRRPLLQAPTGYGKTRVSAEIVNLALGKGKRIVFVVPSLGLIDQTIEMFRAEGIEDIGVIQADHPLTNRAMPVQIATVQTLARRSFPEIDMAIIDEAHKLFKLHKEWLNDPAWQKTPIIGLSATPWTKGLGRYFDDLIVSATTQSLIDGGYLAPFRVFAPAHPDLSGVRVERGDYVDAQLSVAMDKPALVADVVETWIRLGDRRPTLCFAVDRAHAKHLQERFVGAGVPAGYCDMDTTAPERTELGRQLKSGELSVVCNIETLTTGIDWDVRCIIFARPTQSEMLFVQIAGRGLRTAPGKEDCLFLDHADNHNRLGFVTDIGYDELDIGDKVDKKPRKAPLPKECPKCTFLRPAKVSVCPNCGFQPEPARSAIREGDGQLAEMRPKSQAKAKPGCVRLQGVDIPHRDFFGQLKRHAIDRGYAPGWAANQYRALTGVWPNANRDAPPMPISYEVKSWIKSRLLAFIKSKPKPQPAQPAQPAQSSEDGIMAILRGEA